MKAIKTLCLVLFVMMMGSEVFGQNQVLAGGRVTPQQGQSLDIPDWMGLVMADSRYADVLKSLQVGMPQNGYLVVTNYSSQQVNGTIYVYLSVERHTRFAPQSKTVLGAIVGQIILPPGPGAEVTAVYFEPAPQPPGGISIGNQ